MSILAYTHRFSGVKIISVVSFVECVMQIRKHMFVWGGGNLCIKCNEMGNGPINVKYLTGASSRAVEHHTLHISNLCYVVLYGKVHNSPLFIKITKFNKDRGIK